LQSSMSFSDCTLALEQHDRRLRPLDLEALAAHVLDQYRELELAPAEHPERIHGLGFLDPQADVAPALLQQALAQLARGDAAALTTRPGARVDAPEPGVGRLV